LVCCCRNWKVRRYNLHHAARQAIEDALRNTDQRAATLRLVGAAVAADAPLPLEHELAMAGRCGGGVEAAALGDVAILTDVRLPQWLDKL
jgi:hypothetical protein